MTAPHGRGAAGTFDDPHPRETMSGALDREDPLRGDATGATGALAGVDALLAHARCVGRAVRYTLEGDVTPLSREEMEAWLVGAEAEGLTHIRYAVDPRGEGAVRVAMTAAAPRDGDSG